MRNALRFLAVFALFLLVAGCSATRSSGTIESNPDAPAATAWTSPRIALYTVAWCPHCKEAKEYLTGKNIPFENRDVEKDDDARALFFEKYHATGVPLIVIGDDEVILRGFNRETFEQSLEKLKK